MYITEIVAVENVVDKADFAHAVENVILHYEPFASVEVVRIMPYTLSGAKYWVDSVDDDNNFLTAVPDTLDTYEPTESDDSMAVTVVIVVAAVVFLCGMGVIIHHCRKKHKIIYAESSLDMDTAMAVSVTVHQQSADVHSQDDGLRVFKAKEVHI